MNTWFIASLMIAVLSVVAVFVEIPFFSNYAFWTLCGAYIILAGRGQ